MILLFREEWRSHQITRNPWVVILSSFISMREEASRVSPDVQPALEIKLHMLKDQVLLTHTHLSLGLWLSLKKGCKQLVPWTSSRSIFTSFKEGCRLISPPTHTHTLFHFVVWTLSLGLVVQGCPGPKRVSSRSISKCLTLLHIVPNIVTKCTVAPYQNICCCRIWADIEMKGGNKEVKCHSHSQTDLIPKWKSFSLNGRFCFFLLCLLLLLVCFCL